MTAPAGYMKEAGIWRWLEYTCVGLGLRAEAERYREREKRESRSMLHWLRKENRQSSSTDWPQG